MKINNGEYCDCLFHYGKESISKIKAFPTIFFIYSGQLAFECNGIEILAKEGDYLYLKRAAIIDAGNEKYLKDDSFIGISISLGKALLADVYNKHELRGQIARLNFAKDKVVKLPYTPYIQSLYISMIPYIQWKTQPSNDIIRLKQEEGIYCLLLTDDKLFSSLFE